MATLRNLAPGAPTTLESAAPGTFPTPIAAMPVNYAPDMGPTLRNIERGSMSEVGLGYKSSRLSDQANWMEVEAATREAAGDVQGAQAMRGQINGLRQQAAFYAPAEQDITQVGLNPGRILDYGLGAVGSMGASMQDSLLAGGAVRGAGALLKQSNNPLVKGAGLAAAFVPNLLSNSGEQLGQYREDPNIMANTTAGERLARGLGTGVVMGALDTIPEAGILSRVAGKGAGSILRNTALDTGKEMATEVAQTGVQKLDLGLLNPERDASNDWRDYANAAAQAGLGGAPLHGLSNTVGAMGNRVREPGDPGVERGDEIDLKTGKKLDGSLSSFEEQLQQVGGEKHQADYEAKRKRAGVLDGSSFNDATTSDEMNAAAEERRAALIEELTKAGDKKSADFAAKLATMSTEDIMIEPLVDDAAKHIMLKAGLDADSLAHLAAGFKNKRTKRNERNFLPGEANPESIGGLVDTSSMASVDPKKFAAYEAAKKEATTRGNTAARLIEDAITGGGDNARMHADQRGMLRDIGKELAAMASVKKPEPGELFRAERLGRIAGSMLGEEKVTSALEQAGKAAGAWGTPLYSAFFGRAVQASGKLTKQVAEEQRMSRSEAAAKLMELIPAERESAMVKAGVNLRNERVQEYLLDGLQDMFDGDESKVTEKKAVQMFGAEAVDKMRALLGQRIEMRMPGEKLGVDGAKSEKLSSDDRVESGEEGADFEAKQATKRAEKSAIDTLIFGKGVQGRGVPLADALFRNKGRDLPALVHIPEGADRETRKQSGYALEAMMADYGQLPGIKRGKVGKKGSAGSSGYDLAPRTMLSLMDEHSIHEDKRQALLNEYFTKDAEGTGPNAEAAAEAKARLGTVHQGRKLLTALNDRIEKNTPATRKRLTDEFARSRSGVKDMLKKVGAAVGVDKMSVATAALEVKTIREGEERAGVDDTANDAVDKVISAMLGQMPQDKLVAAAKAMEAYIAGQEAEAKDFVNTATGGYKKYFGERYVVAATARDATLNSDSLTMRPHEFREMVDHAKTAYSVVKKNALVTTETGRKVTNQQKLRELSGAEGFLQFENPRNEGTPVVLKAQDIVNWVRKSELGADGDGTSTGYKAFLGYLNQGIAELNRQGFVKGTPYFKFGDEEYAEYGRKLSDGELDAERDRKSAELSKGVNTADPDVAARIARQVEKHVARIERLRGVPAEMTIDGAKAYDLVRGPQSAADDAPLPGKDMSREFALQEQQADHEYGDNHQYDEQTGQLVAEDDGLNDLDDAESGLKRDVDAKRSLEMFSSATAKRDGHITYSRENAVGKAAGVADRWWGMYLQNPKQLFAFVNALTEPYHAAPMAHLFSPERMQKFAKDGGAFHDAAVALRGRAAGMLAGSQFNEGVMVGLTTAGRRASAAALGVDTTVWEGMIAGLKAMARAGEAKQGVLAGLKHKTKTSQPLARREAAAHAAVDKEKVTANERKAEKLEAEVATIDARLAELRKVTVPVAEAREAVAAARDAAKYVAGDKESVRRREAAPGSEYFAPGARAGGKYGKGFKLVRVNQPEAIGPTKKTNPTTPAEAAAAQSAVAAAHKAAVDAAVKNLRDLRHAVGTAELSRATKELNELVARRRGLAKQIDALRAKTDLPVYGGPGPKPTPKPTGLAALPDYKPGQKTMRYAGVGSRRTPPEMAARMTKVAKWLAGQGYTLFSGGADGADKAFEAGATTKEIFRANDATPAMVAVAKEVHPRPDALGDYALKLMARNTAQVFGRGLDNPVDFVLAWTPDGAEATADRNINTGGTGQAIDLASRKGVPVINMAREGWEARLKAAVMGQAQPVAEKPASKPITRATTAAEAIQKRQEYLDNPPADYTTEKAQTILKWAKASLERANARKAELTGDALEDLADNIGALKRLVAKAESVLEGDESLKDFEGPAGDKSTPSAKDKVVALRDKRRQLSDELDAIQQLIITAEGGDVNDRHAHYNSRLITAIRERDGTNGQQNIESAAKTPELRKLAKTLSDKYDEYYATSDEATAVYKANKDALARLPDAMKNFVAALKSMPNLKEGSLLDINRNLMQQMFDNRDNPTWRENEIAGRERRLAGYASKYSNPKSEPPFMRVIRQELKLLKDNDLQGMVDEAAKEFTDEYLFAWPAPKLNERVFSAQDADTDKTAQKAQNTGTQATPSEAEIDAVRGQIGRLLGPQIKVLFEKVVDGNGSWDDVTKTVTIALAPLAQMSSVAYHEGMHGFFSQHLKDRPEVREMLFKAMAEDRIRERVQFLLRNSPAALKAIARDPEEAVAYAFEFWAEGLLDMGKAPATFFEKVQRFFRGVFGLIADSERALEIFQALHDGKMVEPSAAEKAIQEAMERGEGLRAKALAADKQARWLKTRIMAANRIVAESGPVGQALANMWFVNPGSQQQGTEPGVMNRRQMQTNKYTNRLMLEVFAGLSDQDMKDLDDAAASKAEVSSIENPKVKKALANLYKLNADMYRYVTAAGVQLGIRDDGKYTPMVWNQQYMIENKDKFISMLVEKYLDRLNLAKAAAGQVESKNLEPHDVAAQMWQAIIDRTGVDAKMDAQREDGVLSPFFASENGRSFDWIAPEDRKEFLTTNLTETMTAYIHQAVRSAEYVRTFGVGGRDLQDMLQRTGDFIGMNKDGTKKFATVDGPLIKEIRAKAIADKVPEDQLEAYVLRRHDAVRDSVGAMEGVLGKDISDKARKLNSYLMTYQHLRLLPLSLFAAMLDPVGIMVSGGKLDDMISAYVRGMKGVVKTWKSMATGIPLALDGDEDETNALLVGTLDSNMFLEAMGNAHTSEYMDSGVRKINHTFFKLNGLTAWDRNMRISATRAGISFIMSHDKNSNPQHSARWLETLGLKQGELIYGPDGKLVLDARVLANMRAESKAGGADKLAALDADKRQALIDGEVRESEKYANKLHFAIQRFVQRGVLSPNAAVRPAWASDPHYAAIFHLKQYTYGFHEIIMRHVKEEAMHGNYGPGLMALTGVPIMIASDITKGLITGGGSLPGYMANWGLADWLTHGWARAGLNGVGQIGIDAIHSPAGLFGPTADQVWKTLWDPLGKLEKLDMVPGARVVKGVVDNALVGY